jgi:hypothetical protein
MVGPLVYDLAKLHIAELTAERDADRLAASVPCAPKRTAPKLNFGWLVPLSPNRRSGAALS